MLKTYLREMFQGTEAIYSCLSSIIYTVTLYALEDEGKVDGKLWE